ncbi:MAG: acyltransferase, partial [Actinophytocola sp.]|uniref:nitrilase-related carbon-nitrogen hydrolase n=1 Tax=Actinophytocola sp. TaxID=1872138 RepID=UPI0013288895
AFSIILGCSALIGLGALLLHTLAKRDAPLLAAVAPGALWCAVLYLVSFVSPVGMQYLFAVSVSDMPVATQVAALAGGWGVEFLVLFVPAAIAVLTVPTTRRPRTAVVAAVLVVAALGFGVVRLAADSTGDPAGGRRVATVVDNTPHWAVDVTEPAGRALVVSYVDRIGALPAGLDMVVLPEGTFDADDASLPEVVEPMARTASRTGADIVIGVILHSDGHRYNLSLSIPAGGGEPVAYVKRHIGQGAPLTPGTGLGIVGSDVGLMNCLDVNFADPSREYALAGVRFIAAPAADGDLNGWQHSRQAMLRGVEYGFAVAWADQLGTSLLADGHGRPLAQAATTTNAPGYAVAIATVPAGPGVTPYTRLGDWFAWLCLAVTLGACVMAWRRVGKTTRPDGGPAGDDLVNSQVG